MGLTDNFHSRYDLNMPVGVDFPSRLDPGFQSTSKSLECQRFKNLVSLTEKLVFLALIVVMTILRSILRDKPNLSACI